jgi:hypothetical protein
MAHNLCLKTNYTIVDNELTCEYYIQYQDEISDNPIFSYKFNSIICHGSKKLDIMDVEMDEDEHSYFTSFYDYNHNQCENEICEQISFEQLQQFIDDLPNKKTSFKTSNVEIISTNDKIKINDFIIVKCDNIINDLVTMFQRILDEIIVINNNNAIAVLEKMQNNIFEYYPYKFSFEHFNKSKYGNKEFKKKYKEIILDNIVKINESTANDAVKLIKHVTSGCIIS